MPPLLLLVVISAVEPDYVNPQLCRPCHVQIFDSYRQTGMGRSFGSVTEVPQGGTYEHSASKRSYSVIQRDGSYFLRRTPPPFEKRMDFVIGSGNHSQTFVHRDPARRLMELPLSWYAENTGSWRMSPGYDRPDHSDFSREVSDSCLFCHNGYPSQSNGGLAQGIDCQRCHGPGNAHAENPRNAITNPAKLSRGRKLEVCLQCHLESASRTLPDAIRRFDRTVFSYRPGEPLSDYMIYFEFVSPPSDERMTVNGAGYGLLKSKCFLKSDGRLGCTTCHDPHRTIAASEGESHYRRACRSCHATKHEPSTRDCVGCHMQKRRTEDAVHVVMTDHRISKLPLPGNLLAPLAERRDRFSGPVKLLYPSELPKTPENRIYLALGKSDAKALRSALFEEPSKFAEPYFRLGEMLRKAGREQEALAEMQRAIRLSPAEPRAYVTAAEIMLGRNEIDAAIPMIEDGLKLVPDRHPLLNSLAILYVAKGRFEDGLRVLNQAIQLRPDDAATWVNLGVCLEGKQDLRGAAAAYAQALTINPALDGAAAHFRRVNKDGN